MNFLFAKFGDSFHIISIFFRLPKLGNDAILILSTDKNFCGFTPGNPFNPSNLYSSMI